MHWLIELQSERNLLQSGCRVEAIAHSLGGMGLVEALAEVLCPPPEGGVDIAPLLEGFETAEEAASALAGHKGHVGFLGLRIDYLAFDGDFADSQARN